MRELLENRSFQLAIILLLVVIPPVIYWIVIRVAERMTARWISEFVELFPDRCPVCAFHRFGVTHGFLDPRVEPPPTHSCKEKP
jgi:hypothetical protein